MGLAVQGGLQGALVASAASVFTRVFLGERGSQPFCSQVCDE